MPRSPTNYTLPPGSTPVVPDTVIQSAIEQAFREDVAQTFNTPQPIEYGGTNATTAAGARTNLGVASQAVAAMDARRNHDVNGDFSMSQENGNTTSTANGFFPADQWALYRVTSAGTITVGRVDAVTPAGGTKRIRITITAADASLAAGEYLVLSQNLEGSNVADHKYGAAGAFASVRRFGIRSSIPLTFAFSRQNAALNRSWVGTQTIAANTDSVASFAIPGDTTGTWLTGDGVIGFTENIVIACGSTFQGVAGWQAGNILGTSGVTNGMGTLGAVFEIFDAGEKLDPDATGVYGAYQVGEFNAVYRGERYVRKSVTGSFVNAAPRVASTLTQSNQGSGYIEMVVNFETPMAKTPSVTVYDSPGTPGRVAYYEVATPVQNRIGSIQTPSLDGFQVFSDNVTVKGGILFNYQAIARLT